MASRLKYRFEDIVNPNPVGDNQLSPEALYYQRSLYNNVAYPDDVRRPLDVWAGKIYYGKIDQTQNTVIPRVEALIPIVSTTAPNLFALECMVDAFEAFVLHMETAHSRGLLNPTGNEKMLRIRAYEGYKDPSLSYNHYMINVFNSFNGRLTTANRNKIVDFDTFSNKYIQYLKTVSSYSPVTKTNYLLTAQTNIFTSGLTIAIDSGEPEDDAYKYKQFVDDPNFTFFVNSAKKFGLIVDKNIPWRLTLDLFSNAALYRIGLRYNLTFGFINKENFFPVYYSPCYMTDVQDIKNIIVNSYKLFVEKNPLRQERKYVNSHCDRFKIKNHARVPFTAPAPLVNNTLNDKRMAELYLFLRHAECKEPFRISKRFKTQMAEVYTLRPDKKLTALQNVAAYVNLKFRDYIYSQTYLKYASVEALNYLFELDLPAPSVMIQGETSPSSEGGSSY
tara:strand:+ start:5101 stop:6444 length:1344 start_codon:yes stop_codon:yes gene_type:complete